MDILFIYSSMCTFKILFHFVFVDLSNIYLRQFYEIRKKEMRNLILNSERFTIK